MTSEGKEFLVVGYECVEAGSRNPCSGKVLKQTFEANGGMKLLRGSFH